MQLEITRDGSHTLFLPQMNEHYHSTFGAITESMHVFIRNGLYHMADRPEITIFEVGFGTGLNALLTAIAAIERGISVTYYAIEKYPLGKEITDTLNYPALLSHGDQQPHDLFTAIHRAPWNQLSIIHDGYHLHKISGDLADFSPEFNYDLIYFDAFAPEKQPEMWTGVIMNRLISHLNAGGIFATYCAKGAVRRMLKENGLSMERLPGPPGKREMLRGVKKVTGDW